MDPAEKMASKVQLDPAVKMMTATLTKSTKKSGFGRIFLSGEERFFIPGEERFGKDADSSYTLRIRQTQKPFIGLRAGGTL